MSITVAIITLYFIGMLNPVDFYKGIFLHVIPVRFMVKQMQKLPTKVTDDLQSSRPEAFLRKGILKIFSKFTREHPCRSMISIKLLCKFIEIELQHGCSPVNLVHIFRTPFPQNTSGWQVRNWQNHKFFQNCNRYSQ